MRRAATGGSGRAVRRVRARSTVCGFVAFAIIRVPAGVCARAALQGTTPAPTESARRLSSDSSLNAGWILLHNLRANRHRDLESRGHNHQHCYAGYITQPGHAYVRARGRLATG